jgi:hypothetical protein
MPMKSGFYHGKLNMPGIDVHETLLDAAIVDALLNVAGDVDQGAAGGYLEPKFFSIVLLG